MKAVIYLAIAIYLEVSYSVFELDVSCCRYTSSMDTVLTYVTAALHTDEQFSAVRLLNPLRLGHIGTFNP